MSHKWCAMWKVTCDSSERICLDVKYIYHYLTQTKDTDSKVKKGRFSVADIFFKGSYAKCVSERIREFLKWFSDYYLPFQWYIYFLLPHLLYTWTLKKSALNQTCFVWFILQSSWVSQECHSKDRESWAWEDTQWLLFFLFWSSVST